MSARPATGNASLTFAGAAGTVTGSKHLVDLGDARVLLDCGLFQGLKPLRLRNWAPPPFDPRRVDAVVLSHAHIDHSGYLPLLVRNGFGGPVHCTSATADLLEILLIDSAHLQEEQADSANRHGFSKHHPALALYTVDDVKDALALLVPHGFGAPFDGPGGTRVTFRRVGHILGAASVDVELPRPSRHLVFSGDLGRWDRPILLDPAPVYEADVLLVESTYGDRRHPPNPEEDLARLIEETARRGGCVVVPAFAVGRTQDLLYTLRKLEEAGRLPALPVYLDSPMAIDVTALYCRHTEEHDLEMALLTDQRRCPLCSRQYHLVRTVEESKRLNDMTGPMVIIAGSGMATGGRVLHHLARRLPDPRNSVLLVGWQAEGTRGRSLLEGATTVRIHGRDVPVRAQVAVVNGLSAHADQSEILRWLSSFRRPPRHTWVVHGEPAPAAAMAAAIAQRFGWSVDVAADGATVPV